MDGVGGGGGGGCVRMGVLIWGAVLVFIPYLWISIIHLWISKNHLWISKIHFRISKNHAELRLSINRFLHIHY